jgi:hypothetical protein
VLSGQRRRDEGVRAGSAEPRSWRANGEEESDRERKGRTSSPRRRRCLQQGNTGAGGAAPTAVLGEVVTRVGDGGRETAQKIPDGLVLEASWARKLCRAVLGKMYSGELPDARARQSSGGGGRARRSTRGRAVVHAGAPQMGRDGRWAGDAAGVHVGPGARPRDGRGAGSRELAHSRAGSWAASRRPKTGGGSARPSGGGRGGEGAGVGRPNGLGKGGGTGFPFLLFYCFNLTLCENH